MAAFSAVLRGLLPLAGVGAVALLLSGCNDHVSPAAVSAQDAQIVPSGYSPRPAALAVVGIHGAPSPLENQFMAYFDADAAKADVALTNPAGARYLAKGYLAAIPVDGGARLTYVWDIYDHHDHRAQRLNDEIALRGSAQDPWQLVDSAALAALAGRSADELAAYLSNTPEALAAAHDAAVTAQNAGDAAKAVAAPAAPATPARQALSYAADR
ncbi:hypothetical protein K9U39_03715 [Rhodoblastus acidophilus]|uniref:Lipoprotein n=1 Tax=Candidatus Rhodoblastus alkanivorans TaxID=2954117 RepID=A0ABS9Z554_9HYPH|nr:hypothetical protein [Candidatus Rhodoblastus alkanivorans]MCI4680253.1 hypothetical protein [Candidatus Rhodoblastus alkanivorans]MCI4682758.1 hypothetical protein [Candidatus Rhodoblastus alkanivorans]MDI4640065.1 hypothetical protein [Rhodoblastus acidophilus]